ncbi:winged helix-turn-helix domain-containing protein [Streptomyces megasporus]|uniref:winged helix-turn-helix domain-containing protein n=1 Tax=Streptomyces megasporus TaxID=44060 RepID=UPI00068F2CED|nr:winged helix-turn-helix domain-containing protein [Streptomyces megasporus]
MNHTITAPADTSALAGRPPSSERLVTYVVLAPETARVSDLFAPDLTVRRVEGPGTKAPKRPEPPTDPASGLHVDPDRYTASIDGRPLELTYLEFGLLAHLTAHPHRVHTRAHLMEVVWGYDHVVDSRTIDVHVARLRRKLGPVHRSGIATVRRVGYKYVPVT